MMIKEIAHLLVHMAGWRPKTASVATDSLQNLLMDRSCDLLACISAYQERAKRMFSANANGNIGQSLLPERLNRKQLKISTINSEQLSSQTRKMLH